MKIFEIDVKPLTKKLNEGITHIDDQSVPVEKFINVVKNLHKYEITEKVDGNNLKFGLDQNGEFYTSRAGKEGGQYYGQDDWGNDFKDTGFKSAHAALEFYAYIFKKTGMKENDIIEVEILFGDKPNAIPYWPNQIIFLRNINGNANISRISTMLDSKSAKVEVYNVPYTDDGRTINTRDEIHNWTFAKVLQYDHDMQKISDKIMHHIEELEDFLYQPNITGLELTNKENETIIPTNVEVLAMRTTKSINPTKQKILDVVDGEVNPETNKRDNKDGLRYLIKDILLKELVHDAHSTLGPAIEDGGWIEGVVMKHSHEDGDELWKIVDKDIFTSVNKFNHEIRGFISDKHKGENAPIEAAGVLGNLLRDMASETGHPSIGTIQAKRYIKKYGETNTEILKNLASNMNFSAITDKWLTYISTSDATLHKMLTTYNQSYHKKEYIDSSGRTHKYDKTIHARTLQVFASLFKTMNIWQDVIRNATTNEELLMILIGDKLL